MLLLFLLLNKQIKISLQLKQLINLNFGGFRPDGATLTGGFSLLRKFLLFTQSLLKHLNILPDPITSFPLLPKLFLFLLQKQLQAR